MVHPRASHDADQFVLQQENFQARCDGTRCFCSEFAQGAEEAHLPRPAWRPWKPSSSFSPFASRPANGLWLQSRLPTSQGNPRGLQNPMARNVKTERKQNRSLVQILRAVLLRTQQTICKIGKCATGLR